MNIEMITQTFLHQFPEGFDDPRFLAIGRKHRSSDQILKAFETIDISTFLSKSKPSIKQNIEWVIKQVSKSTMISTFQKIAFKNYLSYDDIHHKFLIALHNFMSNTNQDTMEQFVYTLSLKKNKQNANAAKWPIVSFFLLYYRPFDEVFIKPTTIKRFAKQMEVDIEYMALPNWNTYEKVRKLVSDFKNECDVCKHQNNIMVQALIFSSL